MSANNPPTPPPLHPTTVALLQRVKEANDNNAFKPAECWAHIGPAVLAWRLAGQPDVPRDGT